MLDLLAAFGANTAAFAANAPELLRKTPGESPAAGNEESLIKAAKARALAESSDAALDYRLAPAQLTGDPQTDIKLLLSNQLAGHADSETLARLRNAGAAIPGNPGQDLVMYNPNADASFLAHELGHGVSAKSKVGKQIRNMRSNPKLALAGQLAGMIAPLGVAAAIPGDEDLGASMAVAYGALAPTLIDEALATKNGLAIMRDAGMPANRKQKARMAAAYLSYATAPLFGGLMLNKAGNIVDKNE